MLLAGSAVSANAQPDDPNDPGEPPNCKHGAIVIEYPEGSGQHRCSFEDTGATIPVGESTAPLTPASQDWNKDNKGYVNELLGQWMTGLLLGSGHLGLYTSGHGAVVGGKGDYLGPSSSGLVGGGHASRITNDGYGVTDSAGAAPTVTPSIRINTGGGLLGGIVDASSWMDLSSNRRLAFLPFFDYRHSSATFGGGVGSIDRDDYTFGTGIGYFINSSYAKGYLAYTLANIDVTDNGHGGKGSLDAREFAIDATLGHVFTLVDTTSYGDGGTPGAASRPVGGHAVKLDVSGHLGYDNQHGDAYTLDSGFQYGAEKRHYGTVGLSARLSSAMPSGNLIWTPYVEGSVDQRFSYSHKLDIPAQGGNPADTFSFSAAKTFWTGTIGVTVARFNGCTFDLSGYYSASSDETAYGGTALLRVPIGVGG